MRRLAEVLPQVAGQLGLEDQLQHSRAIASWQRIVAEHVPAAAGASDLLAVQPPALLVSATSPLVAQELRLRGSELLPAFARAPGGSHLLELRVVVRPRDEGRDAGATGPSRAGPQRRVD